MCERNRTENCATATRTHGSWINTFLHLHRHLDSHQSVQLFGHVAPSAKAKTTRPARALEALQLPDPGSLLVKLTAGRYHRVPAPVLALPCPWNMQHSILPALDSVLSALVGADA
jgi:hypothetical protein